MSLKDRFITVKLKHPADKKALEKECHTASKLILKMFPEFDPENEAEMQSMVESFFVILDKIEDLAIYNYGFHNIKDFLQWLEIKFEEESPLIKERDLDSWESIIRSWLAEDYFRYLKYKK